MTDAVPTFRILPPCSAGVGGAGGSGSSDGYLHPSHARSLEQLGRPRLLPRRGGRLPGTRDETGYEDRPAFALFRTASDTFANLGSKRLDPGGDAGPARRSNGGLARFRRGRATGIRTAHSCGRIGNPARYRERSGPSPEEGCFPACRRNEFREGGGS